MNNVNQIKRLYSTHEKYSLNMEKKTNKTKGK